MQGTQRQVGILVRGILMEAYQFLDLFLVEMHELQFVLGKILNKGFVLSLCAYMPQR